MTTRTTEIHDSCPYCATGTMQESGDLLVCDRCGYSVLPAPREEKRCLDT